MRDQFNPIGRLTLSAGPVLRPSPLAINGPIDCVIVVKRHSQCARNWQRTGHNLVVGYFMTLTKRSTTTESDERMLGISSRDSRVVGGESGSSARTGDMRNIPMKFSGRWLAVAHLQAGQNHGVGRQWTLEQDCSTFQMGPNLVLRRNARRIGPRDLYAGTLHDAGRQLFLGATSSSRPPFIPAKESGVKIAAFADAG